ncbi:TIGR01841 family phasin [Cupriavidus pinatubonensis]|uniref:Phasin domain-containing protein n=1 Tax=Cupriavidus pinatubonensis TaxID=248026 RepID=A0ABN7ZQ96_9BURK|nr:TIGR01841 family phasin [Cupriavidus pinatubonensis]CAG9186237.1 hypothetical protein LMG23994_06120 [Cupriavidus pinatubonensis]
MPTLPTEQIGAVSAASLEGLFALTHQALAGFQRLAELNLQTMKATLAEAQERSQKALAAKNVQDLLALQASLLQPMCEGAQAYGRQLNEITSGVRAEFTKIAEIQYEANKRKIQDAIESVTKSAPAGSESAVAAWQSAVSVTTTMCEAMQQTAKQAIEVAQSNWDNAALVATNAARHASAQISRAAKQ